MKLRAALIGLVMAVMASGAIACPKGTHPVGGTGSHHKGGTCR